MYRRISVPRLLGSIIVYLMILSGQAQAGGQYFFLEGYGGGGLTTDVNPSMEGVYGGGAALGFGGKFASFPLRFHGVAQFHYGEVTTTKTTWGASERSLDRAMWDLHAGLRLTLPIALENRLRIYFEALFGATRTYTEVRFEYMPFMAESDWDFSTNFSLGLQYRITKYFSVGYKTSLVTIFDNESVDFGDALLNVRTTDKQRNRWLNMIVLSVHF